MKNKKKCPWADDHSKVYGKCYFCGVKGGIPTYPERMRAGADAVPREDRQKMLDLMWEGRNLGDASEAVGITDIGVAAQILTDNISSTEFLRKEAI